MGIEFHINVEQTVFTIALSHIYREITPVVLQQVRRRFLSVAKQTSAILQQVKCYRRRENLYREESLRIIFVFVTIPYVKLPQMCVVDSRLASSYLADSLSLRGQLIRKIEASTHDLNPTYSVKVVDRCSLPISA